MNFIQLVAVCQVVVVVPSGFWIWMFWIGRVGVWVVRKWDVWFWCGVSFFSCLLGLAKEWAPGCGGRGDGGVL